MQEPTVASAMSNYQTRQELKAVSKITIDRQLNDTRYERLIKDCEDALMNMLMTLETISQTDIQNLFYTLKPRIELYHCLAGLQSLLAGVDKLPFDFKPRDWVALQGQFCQHYDLFYANLKNIQQLILKKKITYINVQKAQKYCIQGHFGNVKIDDKLMNLLNSAVHFCKIYQRIEKYHQSIRISSPRISQPKMQQEPKVYMEQKISQFLQESSSSEEEEPLIEEEVVKNDIEPWSSKKLSYFKSFEEYKSKSPIKQYKSKSPEVPMITPKKPQQEIPFGLRHEYKTPIETRVRKFRLRSASPKLTIKKIPRYDQSPKPSLQDVSFGQQTPESMTRQIQAEIATATKDIKKLELMNKRLYWEENRALKSKKKITKQELQTLEYEEGKQSSLLNQSLDKLRKTQQTQQNLSNSQFKLSLHSPRSQFSSKTPLEKDVKHLEIQSLRRELSSLLKTKENLIRDHQKLYDLVSQTSQ